MLLCEKLVHCTPDDAVKLCISQDRRATGGSICEPILVEAQPMNPDAFRSIPRSTPILLYETVSDSQKAIQHWTTARRVLGQSWTIPSPLATARKLRSAVIVDASGKLSTATPFCLIDSRRLSVDPFSDMILWQFHPRCRYRHGFRYTIHEPNVNVHIGPNESVRCSLISRPSPVENAAQAHNPVGKEFRLSLLHF
jgi:hypothetical protein